jgi:hypothetical protein
MSVPGTFKNRPPAPRRMPAVPHVDASLIANGALVVEHWVVGECSVIVAREPVAADGSYRWHLSIAHSKRYPTWDEIKTARYGIPTVAEVDFMAQLLPKITGSPGRHWTNAHDNCFHLYETTPDINPAVT